MRVWKYYIESSRNKEFLSSKLHLFWWVYETVWQNLEISHSYCLGYKLFLCSEYPHCICYLLVSILVTVLVVRSTVRVPSTPVQIICIYLVMAPECNSNDANELHQSLRVYLRWKGDSSWWRKKKKCMLSLLRWMVNYCFILWLCLIY